MKVFYSRTRDAVSFIRADLALENGRIWLAMYKAKTWRDFLPAVPVDDHDMFEPFLEDESDLDKPFDPELVMSSFDGYFPPGLPEALVRQWMPKEIIECFGDPGYDQNVSFSSEHADAILAILCRKGYECVEAPTLLGMMSFGIADRNSRTWICEVEDLLNATERELAQK